ncbi:hypothetical protein TPMD03_57 [Thiohalocapsa phage LS06-2018-MD03]|nr:hypothetical protein TPMD03_57 [Thiohalocapsa phage LS06-2018-MD03]
MAQNILFTTHRGINVKAGETYTPNNANAQSTAVRISRGVRITDENGDSTRIRGLLVSVEVSGLTAPVEPLPNVPVIWYEGEIQKFSANGSYTFQTDGVIEIGEYTAI